MQFIPKGNGAVKKKTPPTGARADSKAPCGLGAAAAGARGGEPGRAGRGSFALKQTRLRCCCARDGGRGVDVDSVVGSIGCAGDRDTPSGSPYSNLQDLAEVDACSQSSLASVDSTSISLMLLFRILRAIISKEKNSGL